MDREKLLELAGMLESDVAEYDQYETHPDIMAARLADTAEAIANDLRALATKDTSDAG